MNCPSEMSTLQLIVNSFFEQLTLQLILYSVFLPILGSDSEASRLSEPGASLNGGGLGNPVGQVGGTETDDDDSEASGSDEEQELRVNGQPTKGACASTRCDQF